MQPKNVMEIFQLLDKSNCRSCGQRTCLAFAGAVFQGRQRLEECPNLNPEAVRRFLGQPDADIDAPDRQDDDLKARVEAVRRLDLAATAERVGGVFSDGRLTVKVLGRRFSVDTAGNLSADIHVNPWVAAPFLDYLVNGKGVRPAGNWVSFRELKGGRERYPLFRKRCEQAMKQVADTYTDLFQDMVEIFNGRKVDPRFASDTAVVLQPLPRVPIMVCYWLPDDGLASSLNVYFDQTVDENLSIGSVFSLGAGLAQMFQKIAVRHGGSGNTGPTPYRIP